MRNIHTLQDINTGHRLGSLREQELSNDLCRAHKSKTEIRDLNERLQSKYLNLEREFEQERKQWERSLNQANKNTEKVQKTGIQIANEAKRLEAEMCDLKTQLTDKQICTLQYKSKLNARISDIKRLRSEFKEVKSKLAEAQKESLTKQSEIASLKDELERLKNDLSLKVSELEHLKSNGEKNKAEPNSSTVKKRKVNLGDFFKRNKTMEDTTNQDSNTETNIVTCTEKENIDNIFLHTDEETNNDSITRNLCSSLSDSQTTETEKIIPIAGGLVESISNAHPIGNSTMGQLIAWSSLIILVIIALFVIFRWDNQKNRKHDIYTMPIMS